METGFQQTFYVLIKYTDLAVNLNQSVCQVGKILQNIFAFSCPLYQFLLLDRQVELARVSRVFSSPPILHFRNYCKRFF